ncbi:MAG: LacI family DNA-binding transcriptional regulator, partial [Glaciihabitans sp.]|nr:LacI family DNA-binding transcriptional regulator [Glaciihabitans sp.]
MSKRLAEVARKVGVSEATVSRVLNEKPGVSQATRTAVLTALDVLGYERPTKLRGERARLVGLFLPELQNPIFPAFGELVGAGLAQNGYTPVLCTQTVGGISEADYVELLLQQQVSGVVFVGGQYTQRDAPHEHYARLAELNLPTVLVNAPVAELSFPTVSTDDAVATEQAWKHLKQLGHTRIGLVLGPRDHVPSQRKYAAARELGGADLPDRFVEHSQYSLEAGQAATSRLLQQGVTAVVCASDPIALGAIRAVRKAGLRVPEDVSIIGFDDSALMNSIDPPLTTVRQPIEPMGRMVIELLVRQITGADGMVDEYLF